jgi:hypothetical protein
VQPRAEALLAQESRKHKDDRRSLGARIKKASKCA